MSHTATHTGEATLRFNEVLREKINAHLARRKGREEKASWRRFIVEHATVTVVEHRQLRSLHDTPDVDATTPRETLPSLEAVSDIFDRLTTPTSPELTPVPAPAPRAPFLQLFDEHNDDEEASNDDAMPAKSANREASLTQSRNALLSLAILFLLVKGIFLAIALG